MGESTRIAVVVPRFGEEVVGGSERLALNYVNLLSKYYQVDVVTTTALDYMSWVPHYKPGLEKFAENVTVYRFDSERRWQSLENKGDPWGSCNLQHPGLPEYGDMLALGVDKDRLQKIENSRLYDSHRFIATQGGSSDKMFQFLRKSESKWKKVIFIPYLYPSTYTGVDMVPKDKVLIILAAHEEAYIHFPCFRKYGRYRWLVFFKSEAEILNKALHLQHRDFLTIKPSVGTIKRLPNVKVDNNSVIFSGRAMVAKGFNIAIKLMEKYRKTHKEDVKLIVTGSINDGRIKEIMKNRPWVKNVGYVPTEERNRLMQSSVALINPSVLDSYGLVNLEASRVGTPVLLNRDCPAFMSLARTCPNGFLTFSSEDKDNHFISALHAIRKDPEIRKKHSDLLYSWSLTKASEKAAVDSLVYAIEQP